MAPGPVDEDENLSYPPASVDPTQNPGGAGGSYTHNTNSPTTTNNTNSRDTTNTNNTNSRDTTNTNSTNNSGGGIGKNTRRGRRTTNTTGNHSRNHGRAVGHRGGHWTAWAFLAPVLLYLIAFYAYPLYRNLDLSLRHYTVRSFVQGGAPFNGLDNYHTVIQNPTFGPALTHTILFTLLSLTFQFTIGMALAVFFRQNFRLSATLRALFLVPWLLPLIVSASTWSWMLNSDSGVLNWTLGLLGAHPINWLTSPTWSLTSVIIANVWIGIPFNLVVLYSGLQTIPTDIYEAAALDGATSWHTFWRITFPLLRPVSAITLLLGLVYTLKVFDLIWIMTKGGPTDSSTTFATWSYRLSFGNLLPAFGPGAAIGNLLIIMALLVGLLYIRIQRRQNT